MSSITCPECGTINTPDSVFCESCGSSLVPETTAPTPPPQPTTTYQPPPPTISAERPSGITILGVLAVIAAILQIFSGIILALIFDSGGIVVPFLIIAIFYFITGWGLLNLKKWSWYIALILSIIGLLGFPLGTVISLIVLWYLWKTRNYFGV